MLQSRAKQQQQQQQSAAAVAPQPDDPQPDDDGDSRTDRQRWARRVARYALPIQVALVAIICAVACLEPHCCDSLNNNYFTFTPQLRYVRGPPPM